VNALIIAAFFNTLNLQHKPVPVVLPFPIVKIKKSLTTFEPSIIVTPSEPQIGTVLVTQGGRCFLLNQTQADGGNITAAEGGDALL
jgi:hypothetical protein